MTTLPQFDNEANDLQLHVELCAQRYKELDTRLNSLESKMDQLSSKIDQYKGDFGKIMVTTAGSIIVAIVALIGVLITKL